ncbi:hypothetical protein JI57_03205 [Psychromonas sp. PRT-SC03]|nr:hypothetical protein JI57_03205 [Psychromonas sp. PRT-SC03]
MLASKAACRNDNIAWVVSDFKNKNIIAFFNKPVNVLRLLDSKTLKAKNDMYVLNSAAKALKVNKQGSRIVVIQEDGKAIILKSKTLQFFKEMPRDNIKEAVFVNAGNELLISQASNILTWLSVNGRSTAINTLQVQGNIKYIASQGIGKYSAVLTTKRLYLIDNIKRRIIQSISYNETDIYGMSLLSDKIIIVRKAMLIMCNTVIGWDLNYKWLSRC